MLLLVLTTGGALQAQTQVIAHRGFWTAQGSAQNSLAALLKADSIGCYGSEFDLWLTADGEVVVNHDSTFKGVTVQDATLEECTALTLDNGEPMPTLKQYLDLAKTLKTSLIVELKEHRTPEQETQAVEQIVHLIKQAGLEERTEYISFSRHAVTEFIRLAPAGTPVYYLNGDLSPQELKAMGCAGADYHYSVFRKHPEWIAQCHELGLKVNVWTVNKKKDMRRLIKKGVDFITTNDPLLLQKLLK